MNQPHFKADLHRAALEYYAECPLWEKTARSMAYAIAHQEVFPRAGDLVGGRLYQNVREAVPVPCDPDLESLPQAKEAFLKAFPNGQELMARQMVGGSTFGHITWDFRPILELGIAGFREKVKGYLPASDPQAGEFYRGVVILLEGVEEFCLNAAERYAQCGNSAVAERIRKVTAGPAETFAEAVQAFYLQHLAVMLENPYGGNGPGWLDRYLWPYLERDLAAGRCTAEQARSIIDALFLLFEERLEGNDAWVEAIVVGGANEDGSSAVNPLSYMMVESVLARNDIHPAVYMRMPAEAPAAWRALAARYLTEGNNRGQIYNDPAVIGALVQNGASYTEAVHYAAGGCMEVGLQGMQSDLLYCGFQNLPKMLEEALEELPLFSDYEGFYQAFLVRVKNYTEIFLKKQEYYSAWAETYRPSYLQSSMVADCLKRGRTLHGGGARYHHYGGTPLGIPDTADCLFAVKQAVYEQKICTAAELVQAVRAQFEGYEMLQARLSALPKYGTDCAEADAVAARLAEDVAQLYTDYTTRHGGKGTPVVLNFRFGVDASGVLGALPDGRSGGKPPAHALTPQSTAMTQGITAAINSCGRMPFLCFGGGASTMWDLDPDWATPQTVDTLLTVFFQKGGQIFQGNTVSAETLRRAQKEPEKYRHLIVRVGGYSARFTTLSVSLQEEIISRKRHGGM